MNKKLFLAMALPTILVGCSQEDLISENIATPQAKAISGLTFTISKNGTNADTRASWGSDNKIQFESADKVSLYWLGDDGLAPKPANDGTFTESATALTDAKAVTGKSNAVFRTENGSSFSAEAVVYEGYNLLVYPANTAHVTEQNVVVELPKVQKAEEDFAKNVIYIGDSIIQIHQPAYKSANGKYYDMYRHEATVDDANTSGYAHGIKTGVKLLSSLLKMKLVIENTNATDVKIQKVVLGATGADAKGLYSNQGNLVPGAANSSASTGSKAQYINPWYKSTTEGAVDEIVLDCENIETVKAGTNVTMLLLPADAAKTLGTTCQPILKVYTNYGVVTVGGSVAVGDAHSNCIFAANGVDYAAEDDNAALQAIVDNATNYQDEINIWDGSKADKKGTYKFNSGVSMSRVIKVDMQKASLEDVHVKNTEELNAILNAACTKVASKYSSGKKLTVYLDYDHKGNFELTDYTGLDAFVTKFKAGALELAEGMCTSTATGAATALKNINLNTTAATEVQNIEGLATTVTITIPATSKITAVKNGTAAVKNTIANPIINNSTITVPANAVITLNGNKGGTIHYTPGATITVADALTTEENYGTIDFVADTKANLDAAAANGANYITVKNIKSGFFDGGIDVTTAKHPANKEATTRGGITVEFDNCGNLNETISGGSNLLKAATIVLSNGTSYPELKNATVTKIIVKSATAVLGTDKNNAAQTVDEIEVLAGETTINNVAATTLTVGKEATVALTEKAEAPTNFYVFGKATFGGSNKQSDEKVYTLNTENKISDINAITGQCLVTGTLELANDLAYTKVAVDENTTIKVAEGILGLGYTTKIFVTKDPQAKGTANLKYNEVTYSASKISWNGDSSDIVW